MISCALPPTSGQLDVLGIAVTSRPRDIKARFPQVNIHGFSPPEIHHFTKIAKLPLKTVLERLKEAGLGSLDIATLEVRPDLRHGAGQTRVQVQRLGELVAIAVGQVRQLEITAVQLPEPRGQAVELLDRTAVPRQDELLAGIDLVDGNRLQIEREGRPILKLLQPFGDAGRERVERDDGEQGPTAFQLGRAVERPSRGSM